MILRKTPPARLVAAREGFAARSLARRALGQCSYCEAPAVLIRGKPGTRCTTHREYNRAKCRAWRPAHEAEDKATSDRRDAAWRAMGRCPDCRLHPRLEPGFVKCSGCRAVRGFRKYGTRITEAAAAVEQRQLKLRIMELAPKYPKHLDFLT